jgi:hypothetical protein
MRLAEVYSDAMAITLTPELEEIVRIKASVSGFESPEAYLRALLTQAQADDVAFAQSFEDISTAIDEGLEQARRGELLDSETVWANLEKHKSQWRAEHAG